jgi:flagellar motor switch protein FliN/FliY
MNAKTETSSEEHVVPQMVELSELSTAPPAGANLLSDSLDIVQNVRTRLTVVAGQTTVSVGELMGLKADQVLKLESLTNEPVDILLEGSVVARGQLVAVDEHFGVRISELPRSGNK